jgi:hypothetical protein
MSKHSRDPPALASAPHWQKRLHYDRVLMPRRGSGIGIRAAAVYSLRGRAKGQAKTIAARLGLDPDTVRAKLDQLPETLGDECWQEVGKRQGNKRASKEGAKSSKTTATPPAASPTQCQAQACTPADGPGGALRGGFQNYDDVLWALVTSAR